MDALSKEQRVWRAALLLSAGRPREASRLLAQVTARRSDFASLDRSHLDRLTVLAARERVRYLRGHPDGPLWRAAVELDRQPFEAWVFHQVDQLDLMEVAKAMDCSTTATKRHLDVAMNELMRVVGEEAYETTLGQLRAQVNAIDSRPIVQRIRRRQRAHRRERVALIGFAIVFIALVVVRVVA